MTRVDRDEFFRTITSFHRHAFRWECQGTYREPDEAEPFRLWKEGRPDNSFMDPWLEQVRGWRTARKTFERVRMVTDPPTEYAAFGERLSQLREAAGMSGVRLAKLVGWPASKTSRMQNARSDWPTACCTGW